MGGGIHLTKQKPDARRRERQREAKMHNIDPIKNKSCPSVWMKLVMVMIDDNGLWGQSKKLLHLQVKKRGQNGVGSTNGNNRGATSRFRPGRDLRLACFAYFSADAIAPLMMIHHFLVCCSLDGTGLGTKWSERRCHEVDGRDPTKIGEMLCTR